MQYEDRGAEVAAVNFAMAKRSYRGNPHCGDEYACWEEAGKTTLCIIDGLGHGEHAEAAAKAALHYVGEHLSESLDQIFSGCDDEILHTRGVAMGIAVIDQQQATLIYGGIGNTVARIMGGDAMRFTSDPGIVGGGYKRFSPQPARLSLGQLVVMYTDGIADKLDISGYGADIQDDLSKLAAAIIADCGQDTDDCAVMIYRYGGP